jgi:phosphotransferase system  glucose/maltose/N-acetylglucosamine-specific IIC component
MSKDRWFGLALSLIGGGSLAFLAWQSMDRALNNASIEVSGMPGTLVFGLVAIVVLVFGLHRLTRSG